MTPSDDERMNRILEVFGLDIGNLELLQGVPKRSAAEATLTAAYEQGLIINQLQDCTPPPTRGQLDELEKRMEYVRRTADLPLPCASPPP